MDQTNIHLVITHLPIFGSVLGALVLIQGIWAKSHATITAAYTVLICSCAGAVIAYLTGEGAEEMVENIQGMSETAIEQHEDFALFALISLVITGIASLTGLFVEYKSYSFSRKLSVGVLALSLLGFILVTRTGYLGGKIRHTELNNVQSSGHQTSGDNVTDENEEDD